MPGPQHGSAIGLPAILTLGLLALSLAACGTSSNFANQRLVAPENLEVTKRKTLAMVEFTGDAGGRLSRSLARRLARVRIDGDRLLEVTGPVALRAGGDRDTDEVGSEKAVALGRRKWYSTIEEMQTDLDADLIHYSTKRPHQGRAMNGRTPDKTFTDGLPNKENAKMKPETKAA